MQLIDRLHGKRPIDFMNFVRHKVNQHLINNIPLRIEPFIKKSIRLNGIPVQFITHKQDKVLGARLRGELGEDCFFLRELELLQNMIKPGSKVLDAGANIGSVAIVLAKVQPTASIFCFEPDPLNFSLLNINIAINGVQNIIPFNFALGKSRSFIRMYLSQTNFGDHRSSKCLNNDLGEDQFNESKSLIMKVNPFEILSEIFGVCINETFDIMKIDTQGADFEILEACIPLLHKGSVVAIEYSPYHLAANGTTREDVVDIMKKFSKIERITPTHDSYQLDEVGLKSLVSYYDSEHQVYRCYYDVLMTY